MLAITCGNINKYLTGHHRLQFAYNLWYSKRAPGKLTNTQTYDQNLKLVGRFESVESFWAVYSHILRPSDLGSYSDFHLFKDGIKPMWEVSLIVYSQCHVYKDYLKDDANKEGGKWIVRLRKGLASRCWENLILAILGEQFMVGEEICGAVISIRFQVLSLLFCFQNCPLKLASSMLYVSQEDIISVWNKTAHDHGTTIRIRDTLRRVLNLPQNTIMEYKTHNDSLRDHSSFRNTDVFVR